MSQLEIGRLLRADTSGFVVGCRAAQSTSPSFGSLVNVPQEGDYAIYGLVHDIRIDDDGLVRQLATAEGVEDSVIADNRINRNVPLEISVIAVGYRKGERIYHLLPPRPALSLDVIYLCEPEEAAPVHRQRVFRILPAHPAPGRAANRRAAGSPYPAGKSGTSGSRKRGLGERSLTKDYYTVKRRPPDSNAGAGRPWRCPV